MNIENTGRIIAEKYLLNKCLYKMRVYVIGLDVIF